MSKSNHTPGPWHTIEGQRGRSPERRGLVSVATTNPGGNIAFVYDKDGPGEADTNARLIAAAPEMHALLRELAEDSGFISDEDGCECGPNGSGFDDDDNPCVHVRASRLLAKVAGK